MLFAVIVGMLTGLISAVFPYSPFDVLAMLIALSGVAMPVFWLGMLAILLFSLQLGWLPSFGRGEPVFRRCSTGCGPAIHRMSSMRSGTWCCQR